MQSVSQKCGVFENCDTFDPVLTLERVRLKTVAPLKTSDFLFEKRKKYVCMYSVSQKCGVIESCDTFDLVLTLERVRLKTVAPLKTSDFFSRIKEKCIEMLSDKINYTNLKWSNFKISTPIFSFVLRHNRQHVLNMYLSGMCH